MTAALATMVATSLAGCTPPQEHMALVLTDGMPTGSPIAASVGGSQGPPLRELEHLELLVAPLVDTGTRQWDQMPTNMAQGRVLRGTPLVHSYVTEPVDLAPGEYALWFRWGRDGEQHTDGFGLLRIAAAVR